ncbi:kinase-like domain-containing protein [Flagelloscypha sp. PMI_526]|nr:kinase-like domain-containing protein [Flagelloscypha sp. PMI_526]
MPHDSVSAWFLDSLDKSGSEDSDYSTPLSSPILASNEPLPSLPSKHYNAFFSDRSPEQAPFWPYLGAQYSHIDLTAHLYPTINMKPLKIWDGATYQADEGPEVALSKEIFMDLTTLSSPDGGDPNLQCLTENIRQLCQPFAEKFSHLNDLHPDLRFAWTYWEAGWPTAVMVSAKVDAKVAFLDYDEPDGDIPLDSSGVRNWIVRLSGEDPSSFDTATKGISKRQASSLLVLLEFVLHAPCAILTRQHKRKIIRLIQKIAFVHQVLPPAFELDDIRTSNHPFGGGGYSDVFEGWWYENQVADEKDYGYCARKVCVKRLRIYLRPGKSDIIEAEKSSVLQAFLKEALIWKQLSHPNILPFLGVSTSCFPNQMSLISPFMENGDIMSYITRQSQTRIPTSADRIQWLLGIAKGVQYIHAVGLYHGDIKGANILINDQEEPCLADLGISSIAASTSETLGWETASNGGFKGSLRWLSPEVVMSPDLLKTTQRDMYAFGSTMLEILSGRPPWSNVREDTKVILNLSQGKHPDRAEGIGDDIWSIIESCWAYEPTQRPTAAMVFERCSLSLRLLRRRSLNDDDDSDDQIVSSAAVRADPFFWWRRLSKQEISEKGRSFPARRRRSIGAEPTEFEGIPSRQLMENW